MHSLVKNKSREWTSGKDPVQARISVFERIRDIHYAGVPELNDAANYIGILNTNKGSCTPKHLLLCNIYRELGLSVLYVVYPFRWDEVEVDYPRKLLRLARQLPQSYHLACVVDICGEYKLIDATLDPALTKLGLPVNESWDGFADTQLAIIPCGEGQIYHPNEAASLRARRDEKLNAFYDELNRWLEMVRAGDTRTQPGA
ncbi:MAG: hypothetical protein IBX68_02150 [Dehalococcoidia bacterium]|nr:hypothetical protein [Dehalococcoidia bacterium]